MTKEQIEQKAEEYSEAFMEKGVAKASFIRGVKFGLKQHSHDYLVKTINLKKKYEEQITELKLNCDFALEGKDNEIYELKEQIEKMKCCFNCKHSRTEYEHCKTTKHEKWEIKEND